MSKMTAEKTEILKVLQRAVERDAEKGGAGVRSTSEVAERMAMTTAKARTLLNALGDDGLVDVFDSRPIDYRITPAGRSALNGEEGNG